VRSFWPHVTIIVDHSNERAELSQRSGFFDTENRFDLFRPRFQTIWGEPISEPIGFLYGPFAFEWIDDVSVFVQTSQDSFQLIHMFIEIHTEDADIVNECFDFVVAHIQEDALHSFLSNVGAIANAHWEAKILVLAEGSGDDTHHLGFFIQFVGVKIHCEIQFGKIPILFASSHDITNARNAIYSSDEHFVEFAEV